MKNTKYLVRIIDDVGYEITKILATSIKNAEQKFRKLRRIANLPDNIVIRCEWVTTPEGYRITTMKELKKGDYFWIASVDKTGKTPYVKDMYDHSAEKYYAYKFYDVNSGRLFHSDTMVTNEVTF